MGNSLFFPAKSKRLSDIISIASPTDFAKSIQEIKKGGVTRSEKAALVLAQNRAAAQLGRANLSRKERMEFGEIVDMDLPDII